ncbi:MAG: hypothetical protein AAF471_01495 [Myxococcota bacterium]
MRRRNNSAQETPVAGMEDLGRVIGVTRAGTDRRQQPYKKAHHLPQKCVAR